jgi:hypothetical protein
MVQVKDLIELKLEDLWREVKVRRVGGEILNRRPCVWPRGCWRVSWQRS